MVQYKHGSDLVAYYVAHEYKKSCVVVIYMDTLNDEGFESDTAKHICEWVRNRGGHNLRDNFYFKYAIVECKPQDADALIIETHASGIYAQKYENGVFDDENT